MITAQDFDFRKTRWGMTIDQVRTSERAKMCEGQTVNPSKNDCICYNEELGQEAYQLRYCFLENKLESASYRRADAESNLSVYVDDFYALKTVLEEKYGHEYRTVKKEGAGWSDYTPLIDTEKDLNRLFKEGTFLVQVIWEKNGRTRIILNFETMNLAKGPSYNLSVDYGPVTKNLLYERNSFSEEDMEKL
jgi:hypothetical protein